MKWLELNRQTTPSIFFPLNNRHWKIKIKNLKKKKKIQYNKIDMLFIPCTSNCRTHLSKTKKNQNSLVYCIKIALAHPGFEKEKLCQTKSFILLLHINVITSSYHTRLQQRWDDQNTMPFITSSQSKIGEITLNNYIKTRAPRTEWICIEL